MNYVFLACVFVFEVAVILFLRKLLHERREERNAAAQHDATAQRQRSQIILLLRQLVASPQHGSAPARHEIPPPAMASNMPTDPAPPPEMAVYAEPDGDDTVFGTHETDDVEPIAGKTLQSRVGFL